MSTQEIKNIMSRTFPQARKIRVRQYPMSYKGSMRGYTTITVVGVSIHWADFQDMCLRALGSLDHIFVDESNV